MHDHCAPEFDHGAHFMSGRPNDILPLACTPVAVMGGQFVGRVPFIDHSDGDTFGAGFAAHLGDGLV
jgi:hypothetical protein